VLATYVGATAQVKPVNGKNPLVQQAQQLQLPMPYENEDYEGDEYEDEDEWDTSDWDDEELPEPMSEDEQFNGAYGDPRDYSKVKPPKRRKRLPPMPKSPRPKKVKDPDAWEPPFEVLADGTVTGPKLGEVGSELPPGFDENSVPKGSFEGVTQIFMPPGSR
jgi:hypothetical protein